MLPGIPKEAHDKNKQQAKLAVPPVREPRLKAQGRRAQATGI